MHSAGLVARPSSLIFPVTEPGICAPAHTGAPAAVSLPAPLSILDDPQEWAQFSRPGAGGRGAVESSLVIEGMTCAACALRIEEVLLAVPGVSGARVSAASHRATVLWLPGKAQPSDWFGAIRKAGYAALPANDIHASEQRRLERHKALWRWLLAGFCMMQVMMYAYPAYVARPGDLTAEMEQLLRWASWVLSLPVMLFSCGPFFRNALRDLSQRRISMDLPVALGVAITFAVSTAGTFDPQGIFGREVYFDSLTMFVFFLLSGRWLELCLRDRTAGALEAAMNRMPDAVQRQRADGTFESVTARRLLPGDIIRVLPGQAFAADGTIVSGDTLVDQALLTGESLPLARPVGASVVAGSHNLAAAVQVRVERTGDATRFAQIVALMQSAASTRPHIAQLADRIARPFLLAVLLAAALSCAFWWTRDPGHALMVAVAVLVVTCPCALSLATPVAMLAGAGSLARAGVLVRRLQALETLSGIDSIVFDKTGTLTRDAMVVRVVDMRQGMAPGQVLHMAAALAQHSLHPVSRALVLAAAQSERPTGYRARGVVEVAGQGVHGLLMPSAGATPAGRLRLGSEAFCGAPPPQPGAGHTCLSDESGWLASFELVQQVRQDASATVAALRQDGIAVFILSGDDKHAALQVAGQLGIVNVQAGCTPDAKLAFLRGLQRQGRRVAMVGDGLNDAPVLAGADVSFAFGQAVPLAQSQADFCVLGEQLVRVVQTLRLARRTMRIVRQNLGWALVYNLACVPLAVLGWLPAWLAGLGMAASSLVVVLNAARLAGSLQVQGSA